MSARLNAVHLATATVIVALAAGGCSSTPSLSGDEKPCRLISAADLKTATGDAVKKGFEEDAAGVPVNGNVCTFNRVTPDRDGKPATPDVSQVSVWAGTHGVPTRKEAKHIARDFKHKDIEINGVPARQQFASGTGRACKVDVYLDKPGNDDQTFGVIYIGEQNPCADTRKIAAKVLDNLG